MAEPLIISIVSALAAVGGIMATGAWAKSKSKVELEASPYEALASRVVNLESQVQDLTRCRDEDRTYIVRLLAMWQVHLPLIEPPGPTPEWFRLTQLRKDVDVA